MCVPCSWEKPADDRPDDHPLEFCDNGAKATLWEPTMRRCTPELFAARSKAGRFQAPHIAPSVQNRS